MSLQRIKELIIENAAYFDTQMNPMRLKMFAEDLLDLGVEEVNRAFAHFRNESTRKTLPMPAEVKSFLKGDTNAKDEARLLSAKIIGCISQRGYVWASGIMLNGSLIFEGANGVRYGNFADSLKSEIGEAGSYAVKVLGGWTAVCERKDGTGFLQAQIRDLCESVLVKERNGTLPLQALKPASIKEIKE